MKNITDFRPQAKNVNKHTLHGTRLLEKSVVMDGWIDGQTTAANGEMISGSARLELSAEKFADVEPIIVHSDGKRPLIVIRDDIPNADDPRARRLSVAANQIAHTDWSPDGDLLKEWGAEDKDIKAMFAESEWTEITCEEKPTIDAEPQIDRAAELLEKWQVKTGDMFAIGEHRLICGDCTDATVVARVTEKEPVRLVIIDPPYGVSYADKNTFLNAISPANRIETPIENDHMNKENTQDLWRAAFAEIYKAMDKGAVIYCFMPQGGDQMMMMMMMMMSEKIEPRHELIWLKNNHVLGRVDYAYKHEPILYAWKEGGHKFYGDFQTSILEYPKPQLSDLHPTMKPVKLIQKLIENSSLQDETVLDSFCGSGTTLIACQNLHRRGRAIEISPAYVAVTLQRMSAAFPGIEIKRLA